MTATTKGENSETVQDVSRWLEAPLHEARDADAQKERAVQVANERRYPPMTCVAPLDGYRAAAGRVIVVGRNERHPRDSTTRVPISIPCGRCIGCRMDRAREWGIRCLHEKKMHPSSVYVTLTYAPEHLPPGWSLSLRDIQLFMKRLRHSRKPDKIRYFIAGEYGETNGRPHYHALLFNVAFRDLVLFGRNKRGEKLYTSRELSNLWSIDGQTLGFCTVGEVTLDSAIYCAKYALKSINVTAHSSPEAQERYEKKYVAYLPDGEIIERRREFAVMSTKPGIGGTFFEKFGPEVVANDSVIVSGREMRPPRYYDKLAKRRIAHDENAMWCNCDVCINKRKRKRLSVLNRRDNTPERLEVKKRLMEIAAQKKERNL